MTSLYTIFFFYAIVGQASFGGLVTTESAQLYDPKIPDLYYLMNFNDFMSSLVTLFHIMVVNNWFITCDMYTLVTNRNLARVYFITFWLLSVLIAFNIVISFIIETYLSVQEITEKEFERRNYILKLQAKFNPT
mmetsp:Transcript_109276/g.151220  ORF Transcript_109276/g.151220 Transcript_109276/m.151220 type:complete len:134 (+) Transcript_109276:2036-2437(+)